MGLFAWIRRRSSVAGIPGAIVVERDGRPVALLDDPQYEEMFWNKWRITPATGEVDLAQLQSEAFWDDSQLEKTVFRCKHSGQVAEGAFWPGAQPIRDGRLVLRGAYAAYPVKPWKNPLMWLLAVFNIR